MQNRQITLQKILFFETVSEFSVLSIFILYLFFHFVRLQRSIFCFLDTSAKKLFSAEFIREIQFCPLMGGVRCREIPLIEVPLYIYAVRIIRNFRSKDVTHKNLPLQVTKIAINFDCVSSILIAHSQGIKLYPLTFEVKI